MSASSHHHHPGHRHDEHNSRLLLAGSLLTLVFMLAEAAGAWFSGSLALGADAGHMLSDALALFFALGALRLSRKRANAEKTFGFLRAEVLAALFSGGMLFFIALQICWNALGRLRHAPAINTDIMLPVALAGLIVNIILATLLRHGDHENLNVRSAFWHVMGDLLSSVAVIAGGILVALFGWNWIDPALSIAVSVVIGVSAGSIISRSVHILMEGRPINLAQEAVMERLYSECPAIDKVHDYHAWSLNTRTLMCTLHVTLKQGTDPAASMRIIKRVLHNDFAVNHSVVQIEDGMCADSVLQGTADCVRR